MYWYTKCLAFNGTEFRPFVKRATKVYWKGNISIALNCVSFSDLTFLYFFKVDKFPGDAPVSKEKIKKYKRGSDMEAVRSFL